MFEDFKGFAVFLAVLISGALLVCGLVFGVGALVYYAEAKPACEQYGRLTGAEISTQFIGASCLVEYQGRWVDYGTAVAKKQEITLQQK